MKHPTYSDSHAKIMSKRNSYAGLLENDDYNPFMAQLGIGTQEKHSYIRNKNEIICESLDDPFSNLMPDFINIKPNYSKKPDIMFQRNVPVDKEYCKLIIFCKHIFLSQKIRLQ